MAQVCDIPNVDQITDGTQLGHKIPDEIEAPFTTTVILPVCDIMAPKFHDWGLTPNDITCLGAIFGFTSVYLVWIRKPQLAAILWMIAYFFDASDGIAARRYNEITVWGDKLDHIRDWSTFLLIFIVIMIRYPMNRWWLGLLGLSLLGTCTHMGLVEKYNDRCRNIHAPDNMLLLASHVSDLFSPHFPGTHASESEKKDYCKAVYKTLQVTKNVTDITVILLIFIYLLTQNNN